MLWALVRRLQGRDGGRARGDGCIDGGGEKWGGGAAQKSGTREGAPGFLGLNAVDRFGHLQHDLGARSHVILQLSGGPNCFCICPCAVKILQQFWGCQAIIFFFFHFFIITLSFSYEYT